MHLSECKATLSNRLRLLRKEMKLTQLDVASQLNIANSTLSQYESCKRMPDYDSLQQLVCFYQTTSDYLLGLADQRHPALAATLSENETQSIISIKKRFPELFSNITVIPILEKNDIERLAGLLQAYLESTSID